MSERIGTALWRGRLAGCELTVRVFGVDVGRRAGAIAGIAFAVFLMTFQGALFCGFLRAAGRVPAASGAEIWVMARGLDCFDFPSVISERHEARLHGVRGVAWTGKMVVGLASWIDAKGHASIVQVIGSEHPARSGLPRPRVGGGTGAEPRKAIVDSSSMTTLGLQSVPAAVEINGRGAEIATVTRGFGSFLGAPMVFTSYVEARKMLRLAPGEVSFLLVGTDPRFAVEEVAAELARRFPELAVLTTHEFARRSGAFWMLETGAGGAISLAGLLGLLIGIVVVTQILHGMIVERSGEVAVVKALGASRLQVAGAIVVQAALLGIVGWGVGTAAVAAAMTVADRLVPWIWLPLWLPAATALVSVAMCALSSLLAVRRALATDPEEVFRG